MAETKTFKWSKLALAASLGVNMIVAGVVAGTWLNGPKHEERRTWSPSFISGPFGRALTEEDRRAMRNTFREDGARKGALDRQRGEMRRIGAEIAVALRADPFDPAALKTLFNAQARLGTELRDLGQQALLERITSMTPEQRAGFADRLENAFKRGRPRGSKTN